MEYKIALIKGDGIGPEIINEAVKVLKKIEEKYSHKFNFEDVYAGGAAIDKFGHPLPDEMVEICLKSDSVLLGAVGGEKWDNVPPEIRPEKGLLKLRSSLGLFCNLRPAVLFDELKESCVLRDDIRDKGIDLLVVRELTGGIYFGERGTSGDGADKFAWDTEKYSVEEIKRIAKIAFESARKRNKKLTSVDKANVLDSSRLWRSVVTEMQKDYPDVELSHMYVDNAAMQLVRDPNQFDVILTTNMFGDILSDEASQVTGSIGMLPSASLGNTKCGVYEPIHGSAPDIAGQNIANPLATILSVAMMLRYSFDLEKEADDIENAVKEVLKDGYRTADIYSNGTKKVTTVEMGNLVVEKL